MKRFIDRAGRQTEKELLKAKDSVQRWLFHVGFGVQRLSTQSNVFGLCD